MISDAHAIDGVTGRIAVHHWSADQPTFVVLLAHGYGEHAGRYEHVAAPLVARGATIVAPDHLGHGASEGDRASVASIDDMVADLHTVAASEIAAHPGLPVVLIGHSMGGLIATRYAQLHGDELTALVLSGPAIGDNPLLMALADLDPIPEVPIDPAVLSRDEAVGAAYDADPLVYHGPFKRETLLAFVGAVAAVLDGPSFGSLPTLWLHGEDDQLVPIELTAATIDRIAGSALQRKSYPGARHEIFNETNQDEVIGDVVAFIDSVR